MFFAAPLTIFVALASSVIAAPGAETKADAAVAAVSAPQHLRTTWTAVNGTLHNLKARGLRINWGQSSNSEVVWAAGDSQCNAVVLSPRGLDPCSRPFSLHGISGLTLEGCGGALWINQNGQFYEDCVPFSEPDACGVHTKQTCL
ncbi:hypothetical protein AURDEDRAFT_171826 [Auricularia subglabra TFB-10046 SS5]|uniref:Uncharacterized protein n=1 Tax=Auricularia subglabra (strain TFB-10046 / SS5) TaxID=717982 RepID=J0WVJ2_AURST|nr:hypothetical protein AURDEDRAFT_171826 [Auricularia subglabra TFB-10046 SS5]